MNHLTDSMYDYRYEGQAARYICKSCNEQISEEQYEHNQCCDYCNEEERCSECFSYLSLYEQDEYNGLCKECYDELNEL